MSRSFQDANELGELVAATVERFRSGEIGPVALRANLERYGLRRDEIDEIRDRYIDECADNIALQNARAIAGFVSGIR